MKIKRAAFLGCFYLITLSLLLMALITDPRPGVHFETVRFVLLLLMLPLMLKYLLQLNAALWQRFTEQRYQLLPEQQAKVSVLIPAWNEEIGVERTIASVMANDYPDIELVVVNDGSTDSTDEVVRNYIKQCPETEGRAIKYLQLENGGKARAMNRALELATGEYVVTLDADSVMGPRALDHLVRRFTGPEVAAVAGNVVIANREQPIELLQQLEYLYGFFFKRADSLFGAVYIIGGAAAAYRRAVLEALGGFDTNTITEDIEMSTRILAAGYKTRYAADAVVYTEGPADVKGLCNQRLRWKFGRFQTFYKHSDLFFSRKEHHSSYLSWFLLPLALYAEAILLFELPLLVTFYGYTFWSADYLPLVLMMLLTSMVVLTQFISDPNPRYHRNLLPLVPVAWVVFYLIDMVELQALIRCIKRYFRQEEPQWQRWVRVGVKTPDNLLQGTIKPADKSA